MWVSLGKRLLFPIMHLYLEMSSGWWLVDGVTNVKAMKQEETLVVTGHSAHFPDGLTEK